MEMNNVAIFDIVIFTRINRGAVIGYMCLIPTPSPITEP